MRGKQNKDFHYHRINWYRFFLFSVLISATNKKSDLELIRNDFSRKQYGSHTILFTRRAAFSVTPQGGEKEGEKATRKLCWRHRSPSEVHIPGNKAKATENKFGNPPTHLQFWGFIINTRNAGTIPIKHADCLKRAAWSLSFNKWILFVGRNPKIFFTRLIHRKKVLTTWNSSAKSYKNFK